MLSRLAATVGFFSASAFARKSAISPSSQLSSTRCSQRRRRLSTSLSSAPCRPTINSESRCWKPLPDATSSNCSAISRPAFPPPLRYTAAFKARLGARTCIRPCVVGSLRLTPISTWSAARLETRVYSKRPASAHFCSPISRITCKGRTHCGRDGGTSQDTSTHTFRRRADDILQLVGKS